MKTRPPGSTSDVVKRSYDEMGGIKEVQHILKEFLGAPRSQSQLYTYMDPDDPDQISYDIMRRLVKFTGSTAAAEDMAALAGGFFVPGTVDESCVHVLAAKSSKEFGEMMAAVFEMIGDPARRNAARKEWQELMHVMACLGTVLATDEGLHVNVTPIRTTAA
jgi:hypothetical protein